MAFSKIIFNGSTLMDVTGDTVTASTLISGNTAHDASGTQITGTASGGGGISGARGTLNVPSDITTTGTTTIANTTDIGFVPTKFIFYRTTEATSSVVLGMYIYYADTYNTRVRGTYSQGSLSRSTDAMSWTTSSSGYLYYNSSTGNIQISTTSTYRLQAGNYEWIAIP